MKVNEKINLDGEILEVSFIDEAQTYEHPGGIYDLEITDSKGNDITDNLSEDEQQACIELAQNEKFKDVEAGSKYKLLDKEFGEEVEMTIPEILEEINRDRSSEWVNYDENDWKEGLEWTNYELAEGDIYGDKFNEDEVLKEMSGEYYQMPEVEFPVNKFVGVHTHRNLDFVIKNPNGGYKAKVKEVYPFGLKLKVNAATINNKKIKEGDYVFIARKGAGIVNGYVHKIDPTLNSGTFYVGCMSNESLDSVAGITANRPMKNFRALPRPEADPSKVLELKTTSKLDKDKLFEYLMMYAESIGGLPLEYRDDDGQKHYFEKFIKMLDEDQINKLKETSRYEVLPKPELPKRYTEEYEHWSHKKVASAEEVDDSYLEWDVVDMMTAINSMTPKSGLARRLQSQIYRNLEALNHEKKVKPELVDEIEKTLQLMKDELKAVATAQKSIKVSIHEDGSRLTDEMDFYTIEKVCEWLEHNFNKAESGAEKLVNKEALMEYLVDHAEHFGGLPMEYEDTDGTVYDFDEFYEMLTEEEKAKLYGIVKGMLD